MTRIFLPTALIRKKNVTKEPKMQFRQTCSIPLYLRKDLWRDARRQVSVGLFSPTYMEYGFLRLSISGMRKTRIPLTSLSFRH